MNDILLDVSDVHVTYQKGRHSFEAVKGVSFLLHNKETIGIVGESGSGKSTLAKAIMALHPCSEGSILFKGEDISSFKSAELLKYRQNVQMVFQDATGSLNPRMTINAMLDEVLSVHGKCKENKKGRILELLDLVGLPSAILNRYPRELSGGQCQRASIARALALDPCVLVADEPVSALDVSVQARILNILRELRERLQLSVILIAHDLAVVRNVCDKVAVMQNGLFEDFDDAEKVFSSPKSDYTKRLLAAVPDVNRALARFYPA